METYTVRKSVSICCAHRLPGHPTCDKLHGHNFLVTMEVTSTGLNPPYGFVVDFGELKRIAKNYDHSGVVWLGSAENLAADIGDEIRELAQFALDPFIEVMVTVKETPGSAATWRWTPDDNT